MGFGLHGAKTTNIEPSSTFENNIFSQKMFDSRHRRTLLQEDDRLTPQGKLVMEIVNLSLFFFYRNGA
jgi:hypothetical protein